MAAADIYANEMTNLMHGYPLWEPESHPEVSIADVGYIRRGRFCRLFNASLPPGHPLNEFGVPEGFEQLKVDERAMVERRFPPGPMISRSVTKRGADVSFSGSLLQAGIGFDFSCAKDRGAILIINSEARRKDSEQVGAFKKYMLKHYKSWYSFANNEPHSRDISLSDLVFVTGRDNTADWAVAAFSERSMAGGLHFDATYPSIASATFSVWGCWTGLRSIHTNCGPQVQRNSGALPNITEGQATHGAIQPLCAADLEEYNQCIFLRGLRVMDRSWQVRQKLGLKIPNNSGGLELLQQPWMARNASGDWGATIKGRSDTTDGSWGNQRTLAGSSILDDHADLMKVDIVSNEVESYASVELLLAYILQHNPEASVAIAHDDDVAAIIKKNDSLDFDTLLSKVAPPVVVDSDGVGTVSVDVPNVSPEHEVDEKGADDPHPSESRKASQLLNELESGHKPLLRSRHRSSRPKDESGKPGTAAYDEEQERIAAVIDVLQVRLVETRAKLSLLWRNSRASERRAALRAELDSLRDQQLASKASRDAITADLKRTEEEIRIKIKDIQSIAKKLPAKGINELQEKARNLDEKIEAGNMSNSEEKKIVGQLNSLRRSQTVIAFYQTLQGDVETNRAKVDQLRKQLDTHPQNLVERLNAVRAELDRLQSEYDDAYTNRQQLYQERDDLQKQLSALHEQRRQTAEKHRETQKAYQENLTNYRAQEAERLRAEKNAQEERKRAEARERLLEKARVPAFAAEIRDCRTLLEYFSSKVDLNSTPSSPTTVTGPQRQARLPSTENYPGAGWTPLKKKEDNDAFFAVGGKYKAKNAQRQGTSSSVTTPSKVIIPLGIMSTLMSLSIVPPSMTTEIPRTIEDIKKKIQWFETNQTRVTEENVARIEADLYRIGHFKNSQTISIST